MLMLNAYFDETGHEDDPNAKIAGIGGLMAPAYGWEAFEQKWQKALDDEGFEYFHMSEFAQSVGQFRKWKDDPPERSAYYERLWDIIVDVQPLFAGCFFPLQEYRTLLSKSQRKAIEDVYFVAYTSCVGTVFHYCHEQMNSTNQIAMFFDNKEGFKGRAFEYYDKILEIGKGRFDDKIPPPVFRNMRKLLPLQAANIVAYECSKEYGRRLYSPQYDVRPGFKRIQEFFNKTIGFEVELGGDNGSVIFQPVEYIEGIASALATD